MSLEQRLRRQYEDGQQLWQRLHDPISDLEKAVSLETRVEEKHRLRALIEENTSERTRIEQQLQTLEAKLADLSNSPAVPMTAPQPLPQTTTSARLIFDSGASVRQTRLFAGQPVVLGRPMTEQADLWLTLLPLDNPEHHQIMDQMSRRHALIRWDWHPLLADGGSRNFTFVNGAQLDISERILRDGDEIAFQRSRALVLRVRCEPGQWLRLERVNNGADEENYLLLCGRAAIGGEESAIPLQIQPIGEDMLAELCHVQGGFVITAWSDSITVNGTSVANAIPTGLCDGDRIVVEEKSFLFRAGAYDGGSPGLKK
jgi:hypothetical protein